MTLPNVDGWLLDFRTAKEIFDSGSNQRIDHVVALCEGGNLHVSHCEEALFKADPRLKSPFLVNQNCVFIPDDDVMQRCLGIASSPPGLRRLQGNDSAVFITAIAASKNFGVISNHRSPVFTTVYDLCTEYGLVILTSEAYFEML